MGPRQRQILGVVITPVELFQTGPWLTFSFDPMKTHTPGPWRIDPYGCDDSPAIVRVFPCGDSEPIAVPINSGFAHLQLMSSAPELLAALELIYSNAGESPEWIRSRIGSVIEKAKGQL